MPMPTAREITLAKRAHDTFLSNLIVNHILLFSGIATLGQSYFHLMGLVPIISVLIIAYTLFRAAKLQRADSEFVFIHWQIAARWSRLLAMMLSLLVVLSVSAWLAHTQLGLMREMSYALAAGLGLLPTLVSVLVLVVVESDALHHAKEGTYPKWAHRRFLAEVS
ncbi:MAG: hypothetical protein P8J13_06660 [Gammaproteobacteria bacterium]|jgi:hypothetical protein|nr:hypothetical protein [Gammaproteobacteria bacterium]